MCYSSTRTSLFVITLFSVFSSANARSTQMGVREYLILMTIVHNSVRRFLYDDNLVMYACNAHSPPLLLLLLHPPPTKTAPTLVPEQNAPDRRRGPG